MDLWTFISLDLPPLFTAGFAAVACALLGNYLVLRRLSLMGDAISHSVLPGIVVAFLLTSSRSSLTVFVGAVCAAILSALLTEMVRRYGNVEPGAAMGVIFSLFFAAGVLLIEQASARSIDLDADCLLHGQLESIFWYPPSSWPELFTLSTLKLLPVEVISALATLLIVLIMILLFYKELKISSFDPALSTSLGYNATALHHFLMILVACAVVASFKAVGSILVIAMIICPAATARLYTDKLSTQLALSALFAAAYAGLGYLLGAFGPLWLGYENSVSASGMMAVTAGFGLSASVIFAPYGVVVRALRQFRLSLQVRSEDVLALLYRLAEQSPQRIAKQQDIWTVLGAGWKTRRAIAELLDRELIKFVGEAVTLSTNGRTMAQSLIRSHRLWESYLVSKLGLESAHVHDIAERLEHFTGTRLQQDVAEQAGRPELDPHGREVP